MTEADVLRVMAAVYHGVVPGVATDDLESTARALRAITSSGFKRVEVEHQPEAVRHLIQHLADATAKPVGMSSMGPLIYVLHRVDDGTERAVGRIAAEHGAAVLGTTSPARSGHRLDYLGRAER